MPRVPMALAELTAFLVLTSLATNAETRYDGAVGARVALAVVAVVVLNDVMLRAGFTLIATLAVLLISLGLGPVSKLLSVSPLVRLGRFELDFYVFHQPCIWLAGFLVAGHARVALLGLALTVVSVALWRALKPVAIKRF